MQASIAFSPAENYVKAEGYLIRHPRWAIPIVIQSLFLLTQVWEKFQIDQKKC